MRTLTMSAYLAMAILGISGIAIPVSAATATVGARSPAALSVEGPKDAQRYFLSLTVAPVRVDGGEGYFVAVYDSAAGTPTPGTRPLATFSFFPPPQVGKPVEFTAPLPAEAVAKLRETGRLALTVALVPVEPGGKLETSAIEVRSARLRTE